MAATPRSLTVGPKGQVVIPKDVCMGDLRGILPRSENGMADWEAEKRRECAREDGQRRGQSKQR